MTKFAEIEATQIGFRVTIHAAGTIEATQHFKVNVATFNRKPKIAADQAFNEAKEFAAAHGCK